MPTITYNLLKATFVPLEGGRAAAPREFTASFPSPHPKEGALELAVEVDDWGRPRCRRLTVSAPGEGTVSGETLRRIPVARLLGTAMSEAAVTVENLPGGITQFGPPSQPEYDAISDRFDGAVRKPRQGSPVDDAHLERVAAEYRRAQSSGAKRHAPTEAVRLAMNVSRSTAGRWVAMARKRGLLEPGKPGAPRQTPS